MNPNYVVVVKQDLDKFINACFIAPMEEANWLSLIVIILKKNNKLKIYLDFRWLNATTKKDPYPLPFTKEVQDEVTCHKVYSFLDGFFSYHQIMITPKDRYKTAFIINWGTFVWIFMPFGLKNAPPTYQQVVNMTFKDNLGMFMKLFMYDFKSEHPFNKATIMFW